MAGLTSGGRTLYVNSPSTFPVGPAGNEGAGKSWSGHDSWRCLVTFQPCCFIHSHQHAWPAPLTARVLPPLLSHTSVTLSSSSRSQASHTKARMPSPAGRHPPHYPHWLPKILPPSLPARFDHSFHTCRVEDDLLNCTNAVHNMHPSAVSPKISPPPHTSATLSTPAGSYSHTSTRAPVHTLPLVGSVMPSGHISGVEIAQPTVVVEAQISCAGQAGR